MPRDLATSRLSRMAKDTPSSTAWIKSARVVDMVMPMKVPLARTSLIGLLSPIIYGRKKTWFLPSLSSVMAACSPV